MIYYVSMYDLQTWADDRVGKFIIYLIYRPRVEIIVNLFFGQVRGPAVDLRAEVVVDCDFGR